MHHLKTGWRDIACLRGSDIAEPKESQDWPCYTTPHDLGEAQARSGSGYARDARPGLLSAQAIYYRLRLYIICSPLELKVEQG
jgi:hypothetical protein